MADACAAACSSSSMAGSASSSYSQYYDVFINHRGPDVKDTFATPLYRSLTSCGLQVFLDRPEMQAGQDIRSQIEGAIHVSSVHIAIFSPRYAESKWCLDELFHMVESVKSGRATILPIFYKVNPSDLRHGAYAEALCSHEEKKAHDPQIQEKKKPRYTSQTTENWRDALSFVANISGFDLEAFNGDEEELLDKVVQSVLKIVPPQLDVAKYPTGLKDKLEEFERAVLLERQGELHADSAKVVGIVGLGGVGKTTLAKDFFNRKRSNYKGSSFLFDVRDNKRRGNLSSLQGQLIKELKQKEIKIDRVEEGIEKLKRHLLSFHALVILDDVDHVDQLDAILPIKDVLDPNSLILVTSRDKSVLTSASILESSIYHLRGLNRLHSQQLFCSHVFSRPDPLPGFEHLVYGFIKACDGLPLSLKVLGALLCGKNDISYWKELLDGLKKVPTDIESRLRISYDSLNEEEQQIFLDIACFCIGGDRDSWIRIWGGTGWKGLVGFRNIQSKCLVDVDNGNMIRMHDHLRDMGRSIADSSRSVARRLWQPINNLQDIKDLLDQSSSVITEVRGLRMALDQDYLTCPSHTPSSNHEVWGMRKLQLLEIVGTFSKSILTRLQSPKLIWLCWWYCPWPSLPSWIPMQELRVLDVYSYELKRLWECESQAPLQLRELIIDAPLVEFPKSLEQLKHLEKIVARNTFLATFPEKFSLPSLKYLELDGCQFQLLWQCESQGPLQLRELIIDAPLIEFPKSLGQLKHLEKIVARNTSLTMFPEEFNLPSLKYLELDGCQFQRLWQSESQAPLQLRELIVDAPLVEFPRSLGQLKHLEIIVAQTSLPTDFCYLPSLKYLKLKDFELETLPDFEAKLINIHPRVPSSYCRGSIGNLANLRRIECYSLEMLPKFLCNLTNLQHIDLYQCESLKMLPNSFGNLTNLQSINLSYCRSLERLPDSFGNLTDLQDVDFKWCESLKVLPNSIGNLTNLRRIDLSFCKSLETLPKSLGNLWQLKHLPLNGCCSLVISSETLGNLTNLECLSLSCCPQMELLPPQIGRQLSLEKLNLLGTNFKELPSDLVSLSNLEVLRVGSPLLEELPLSLGRLANLKKLLLHECEKLKWLPDSVDLLSQLTELKIWKCGIQYLPPTVMKMKNLKVLTVCSCPLRELPFKRLSLELSLALSLDSLINEGIQELQLYRTEVSDVSFPQGVCPNLQKLRIVRCEHLVEVGALPTTLKFLDLRYCPALSKIRGIYGVAELETLDLVGCYNIEREELRSPETWISWDFESLRSRIEPFDDDSSVEGNILREPFCLHCSPGS